MKNLFIFLFLLSLLLFVPLVVCLISKNMCELATTEMYSYIASGSIHLALFSFAMFFLWKGTVRKTLEHLGFPGSLKNTIIYTLGGLATIFTVLFILGLVATLLGFADQQNVMDKIVSLMRSTNGLIFVVVGAVLIAPISEELFFRAFLLPRIGIVFSSLFFGVVHVGYGSIVEIVGAVLMGAVFALIFRSSKSITPCILLHMTYNAFVLFIIWLLRVYLGL